ncbi:RHS repeat-associated core domain-containing protein [Lactococcus lactis]|uniref:RHS repeat-associated core domain-containing protein n=1 Tax=Lactococcus lactis TaxID=1358 RepID=A0A9X4NJA0_9LACT|nr:RHS repeat-associated core domain-containing protein [Lactococcus lactis]MDG4985140.1 RHS repeat-associated core domain-containing protein [Lactococcus lactis]
MKKQTQSTPENEVKNLDTQTLLGKDPGTSNPFPSDAFTMNGKVITNVDPRTGTYSVSVPLLSFNANNQRGPQVSLSLVYTPFLATSDYRYSDGFGDGWKFLLSHFNSQSRQIPDKDKILQLRDGRELRIDKDINVDDYSLGQAIPFKTVDIKDVIFTRQRDTTQNKNYFEILYKNGDKEVLEQSQDEENYRLTKMINEQGYTVHFNYDSKGLMQSITDMDGTKTYVNFLLVDQGGHGHGSLGLSLSDNCVFTLSYTVSALENISTLTELEIPGSSGKFKFSYFDEKGYAPEVKSIEKTGCYIETIHHNAAAVSIPKGFEESDHVVYPDFVSAHEVEIFDTEGNATVNRSEFSFSGDYNYLGYDGHSSWDKDAIDNCYSRPSDYTYGMLEKRFIGENSQTPYMTILRTYNKYHCLIQEKNTFNDSNLIKEIATEYYVDTSAIYDRQDVRYKLPKEQKIAYIKEGVKKIIKSIQYSYDKFGNLLEQTESGDRFSQIQSITYEEADQNGFVRDPKTIDQYFQNKNNDHEHQEYEYITLTGLNQTKYRSVKAIHSGKVEKGSFKENKLVKLSYVLNPNNKLTNGLLFIRENFVNGDLFSTIKYDYSISKFKNIDLLDIQTTTTNWAEETLKESKSIDVATGLEVDGETSNGVKNHADYDSYGRVSKIFAGVSTSDQIKTEYEYSDFKEGSALSVVTEISPDALKEITYYNGFGKVSHVTGGKAQQVINRKKYDALGRVIAEHVYDYQVGSVDVIDREKNYVYNDAGNVITVNDVFGDRLNFTYDYWNAQTYEFMDYDTGKVLKKRTTYDFTNQFLIKEEQLDENEQFLTSITYTYGDDYGRLTQKKWENSQQEVKIETYQYDNFDRVIKNAQSDSKSQTRTLEYDYSDSTPEPLLLSISVDGTKIGKRQYDSFQRLIREQIGNLSPKKLEYSGSGTQPSKVTGSNNQVVNYTYRDALGGIPNTIEGTGVKVKYEFDAQTSLLNQVSKTDTEQNLSTVRKLTYDNNKNLIQEVVTQGGSDFTVKNSTGVFGTIYKVEKALDDQNFLPSIYTYNRVGQIIRVENVKGNDLIDNSKFQMSSAYLDDLGEPWEYIIDSKKREKPFFNLEGPGTKDKLFGTVKEYGITDENGYTYMYQATYNDERYCLIGTTHDQTHMLALSQGIKTTPGKRYLVKVKIKALTAGEYLSGASVIIGSDELFKTVIKEETIDAQKSSELVHLIYLDFVATGETTYVGLKNVTKMVDGISICSNVFFGVPSMVEVAPGNHITDIEYNGELVESTAERIDDNLINCSFDYDGLGREIKRSYKVNNQPALSIGVTYNINGQLSEKIMTMALGTVKYTYQYDWLNRIKRVTVESSNELYYPKDPTGKYYIKQFDYTYDNFDNIQTVFHQFTNGQNNQIIYQYDKETPFLLKRITNSHSAYPQSLDLSYDLGGNVSEIASTSGTYHFVYDIFNKITTLTDKNGISTKYSSDTNNQQSLIKNQSKELLLGYQGTKRSVVRNKQTDKTSYTSYNYTNQLDYVTEKTTDDSQDSYFLNDFQETTCAKVLFKKNQTSQFEYQSFTPYGGSATTNSDLEELNQFAGILGEAGSEFYHAGNGNRIYSPLLRRFLQLDPVSMFEGSGINPYAYCMNDPVNQIDPTGNMSLLTGLGIFLAAVGVAASVLTLGIGFAAFEAAYLATVAGAAAATSAVLGTAATATAIASGVLEDSDPGTAQTLGYVSMGLGALTFISDVVGVIGLASARGTVSASKLANASAQDVSRLTRPGLLKDGLDFPIADANHLTRFGQFENPALHTNVINIRASTRTAVTGPRDFRFFGDASLQVPNSTQSIRGSLLTTHGDWVTGLVGNFNGNQVTAASLGRELMVDLNYQIHNNGGPLFLMTCGSGVRGSDSIAQSLASTLNRSVMAFDSFTTRGVASGATLDRNVNQIYHLMQFGSVEPSYAKLLEFTP